MWALTSAERRALGIKAFGRPNQAIKVMESSELVGGTLGRHVFDFFLRNKREEWAEYRRQVNRYTKLTATSPCERACPDVVRTG